MNENTKFCYVEDQNLITNQSSQIVTDLSSDATQAIEIHYGKVFYFPRELEKFLTALEGIWIHHSKLRMIMSEDLIDYKNLRVLKLENNDIKMLAANLFSKNLKLELINLSNNPILYIDPRAFDGLSSLKSLDLRFIICRNFSKSETLEKVLKVIETIKNGGACASEKNKNISIALNHSGSDIDARLKQILTIRSLNKILSETKSENLKLNEKVQNLTTFSERNDEIVNNFEIKNEQIILVSIISGISLFTVIIHCCICCKAKPKEIQQNIPLENSKGKSLDNQVYGQEVGNIYEELKF